MEKGKYGIYLWFYAVLAFLFTFLGQTLLGGLLLGFVIVVEKNEWLTKQVIQAFLVTLFATAIQNVLGWFSFGGVDFSQSRFLWSVEAIVNNIANAVNGFINFLNAVVTIFVYLFSIIGIIRVAKGQDANLPLIAKIANRAFGIVEKKIYTNVGPNNPPPPPPPQQML